MGAGAKAITAYIVFMVLLVGLTATNAVNSPFATGPRAGITLLHDGKPVTILQVTANDCNPGSLYLAGSTQCTDHFTTGTTDGSGTFSYGTGTLWFRGGVVYTFFYNATGYSAVGTNYSIVTVSV